MDPRPVRFVPLTLAVLWIALAPASVSAASGAGPIDGGSVDDPVDVVTSPGSFYPVPFDRGVALGSSSVTSTLPNALAGGVTSWYSGTCQPPATDCLDFLPDFAPPETTLDELVEDGERGPDSGIADLRRAGVFPGSSSTDFTWVFAQRTAPPPRFFSFFGINPTEDFGFIDRFTGVAECATCQRGWFQYLQRGNGSLPTADATYDLVSVSVDANDPTRPTVTFRTAGGVPSTMPSFSASPRFAPSYTLLLDADGDSATGSGGFERSIEAVWTGGGWGAVDRSWNGSAFTTTGTPVGTALAGGELSLSFEVPGGLSPSFAWLAQSAIHLLGPNESELWFATVDATSVQRARPLAQPEVQPETAVVDSTRDPRRASVVSDPVTGRSAVVWEAEDGSGTGVFFQVFEPDGSTNGRVVEAAASPAGEQRSPRAAWIGERLVVVWSDQGGAGSAAPAAASFGGDPSIVARGFQPSGDPVTEEVAVSEPETGVPEEPSVDADSSGDAVVGWRSGDRRARGRRLGPDTRPSGPEIELGEQGEIAGQVIATAATGDFVVAVERPGSGIAVRAFRADGTPKGPERVISDRPDAGRPAIATNAGGRALVAWEAPGESGLEIFGRLITIDGAPLSGVRRLNEATALDQRRPAVGANSVGDFAVVWESGRAEAFGERREAAGASAGGDRGRRSPRAVSAGATSIVARFFDPNGEPQAEEVEVAETDATGEPVEPEVTVDDSDRVTVVYGRRSGGRSRGVFRRGIEVQLSEGACTPSETSVCLADDRFRVSVEWRTFDQEGGSAQAVSLTGDTAYFWFFDRSNVELVVKVLDACSFADRFWVFAGGLTNVEVAITVDDTLSGRSRSYFSSLGSPFQPIQDTDAFDTCAIDGAAAAADREALTTNALADWRLLLDGLLEAPGARRARLAEAATTSRGACSAGADALCLVADRFAVEVEWQTADGASGVGRPVALTADTGYFWFFEPDNVELVVKVLDACSFADSFWVFAGGLTGVEVQITVTDVVAGERRVYRNAQGVPFAPVQDTAAFATCPP